MSLTLRLKQALSPALLHLAVSLFVAALAAALVFGHWYPGAFRDMAGGRELFLLIVAVDVVCGPLLTLVFYNRCKPKAELARDLGLVALIQVGALVYGLHTVWLARPLYLVHEVDRFKVIARADLAEGALNTVAPMLMLGWFERPLTVGLRQPTDKERETVLFESIQGGRDYGERPNFYAPYDAAAAAQAWAKAKPIERFTAKSPEYAAAAAAFMSKKNANPDSTRYLPVIARQDWIALLDAQGYVVGFVKGDGF